MIILRIRRQVTLVGRSSKSERGITLVELMVAMLLFGVLATLLVSAVLTFTRTFTKDRVATENTSIAAVGMNELTRIIRAGTMLEQTGDDLVPFEVAKPEELVVYAYIDTDSAAPKPVRVVFKVDSASRELKETRYAAEHVGGSKYWTFKSTPSSTRTIARKIVVPASGEASMFTYFEIDKVKESATYLKEKQLSVSTGAVVDRSKIEVIEVRVKVQSDTTGRAAPVTIINRVGIPNLGVSRLGAPAS